MTAQEKTYLYCACAAATVPTVRTVYGIRYHTGTVTVYCVLAQVLTGTYTYWGDRYFRLGFWTSCFCLLSRLCCPRLPLSCHEEVHSSISSSTICICIYTVNPTREA